MWVPNSILGAFLFVFELNLDSRGYVIVEWSKAPILSITHLKVAGSSPAAASMAVNSSEVELRHIEVVNGWYTVRVLLHAT